MKKVLIGVAFGLGFLYILNNSFFVARTSTLIMALMFLVGVIWFVAPRKRKP